MPFPFAFLRATLRVAFVALTIAAAPVHAAHTLLVFGDSLSAAYGLQASEGWVSLLAERIAGAKLAWSVVNASVSGETTAGGLRRLPEDLKRHKPDIVVIELGANDALRGQPLAATRANLEKMVRLTREARAQPVLVGLMIPPNYGIDYAREFRELYARIAKREKVPIVPFLLAGVAEHDELFQADRLHPTAAAQPVIRDNVWSTLEPLLAKKR
ncbi:MAG: arylesterase [Bacillota bacterium]